MTFKTISRRWFLKTTGLSSLSFWGVLNRLWAGPPAQAGLPAVDPKRLVAALGDTIIPTAEGYPGYKRLEQHGITDEVLKGLEGISQADFDLFNAASRDLFNQRLFVDLNEQDRAVFLQTLVESFPAGSFGVADFSALTHAERNRQDPATLGEEPRAKARQALSATLPPETLARVQNLFRLVRIRVLTIFYQNFPENEIARDQDGIPILAPDDQHQILNPNTSELVTGWDVANFPGPLSFAEEEARRAKWMKINWNFGDSM
jgi:hypothetical protein